ncbi:MAG: ATP-binding cassette domain-containing protein [Bacteroidales bacterium]|nr:ATP-binding cassette domain-containing protein [Bacteroidales bacterium]MBN2761718.1 ATP-binding cassette domain-containing protein [Bacteroidales bacterium]
MISFSGLSVIFGGQFLFRDISFVVNPKDKIGLVGRNGAGKTTLLKIIMGQQSPDEGQIVVPQDIRLGYLPQQMTVTDRKTLADEASGAFDEIRNLEKEIEKLTRIIETSSDTSSEAYLDTIDQLAEKNERFHMLDDGNRDQKIELVLSGLGFSRIDFSRPTREFSGGWRMRIELAKILLRSPDVILLDEPTNHLDIDSIQWLEEYLKNYHGAVVLISHDRALLDTVTTRTVEISLGRLYDYRVPYSQYLLLRKERREQQIAAYRNQQKLIDDTRAFIERFRYKNTKAVQVQSRIKMLDKMDIIEVDEEDTSAMRLKFPPAPRSGTIVFEASQLSKRYGQHTVFNNIDIRINRGDRIAFVGRNGEGKTTLSKIIAGELDYEGELKTGYKVLTGYFAQNQDELLDGNKTVLETLDEVATGDVRTKLRDILGSFLFSGEDAEKKVKVLSGGERSRLALARLLLETRNFLILDEPTNHLDMRSKDILKQALLKYDGTLVVVSHDREFLDGLVNKVYEFSHRQIKEHMGGIYDFLQRKKIASLKDLERKSQRKSVDPLKEESSNKTAFLEKKEHEKEIRKLTNKIEKTELRISETEKQIASFEKAIANPLDSDEQLHDPDFYKQYQRLQQELGDMFSIWEKLHNELESLKNKRN